MGLTKSRMAALETLRRMNCGMLQGSGSQAMSELSMTILHTQAVSTCKYCRFLIFPDCFCTKSELGVARMGFGSLQIDTGALLVMGEHVEVQMRLVEGCLGRPGKKWWWWTVYNLNKQI